MKSNLFFCLALVLSASSVLADVEIFNVSPTNSDMPISVKISRVAAENFGIHFTVLYKTNETTLDRFLSGQLEINSNDRQIALDSVQKVWKTNGVQFEFTVSPAYLNASKFTISEQGHDRDMPMPDLDIYWFYLRDFVTNSALTNLMVNDSGLSLQIIKALPEKFQSLHSGMTANEVWEHLFNKSYAHFFGGESHGNYEHWWITWNYEAKFYFQSALTNQPYFDEGKRKLIRAVLYKNGKAVSQSKEP